MGNSRPDATSLAKSNPGDQPAGSGGRLSTSGNRCETETDVPARLVISNESWPQLNVTIAQLSLTSRNSN